MRTHERNTTEHVFPVPDPLLTAKEAAAYRRQGVSTLWRQVKQGLVPKPIYITARSPRWYSLRPKAANGNQRVRTSKEAATGLIEGALTKANHAGAPINQVREFRRDERGRLILAATPPDSTAEPTDEDLAAMLAAQCAAYAAAGMPFASSGKYGLWRGRADLDPPVAGLSKNRLAAICTLAIDNGSLIKMPMADDQRAIFLDVQGGALSQGMAVNIPSGSRRLALRARDNADGGQEVA